MNTGSSMA